MAGKDLSREELDERVAILKRLRQLLDQQRTKFREYLTVLEKQETVITSDNIDAMVRHTEVEQNIVAEIHTIQKVIDPLEMLYRDAHPGVPDTEIPRLKTDLEHLKSDVLAQNEKNRELLKKHMVFLREKVTSIKNPYLKRNSIYASDSHTATRIDINQ
ncbi:MAG: flagellar biosynthesis protein FlgN [Spirochaetales bacterium]|nr:flagellar biosynthesis protein FlgN [Spirochaetales bacterium]